MTNHLENFQKTHQNDILHYGVKGMKWGVRNDPIKVGKTTLYQNDPTRLGTHRDKVDVGRRALGRKLRKVNKELLQESKRAVALIRADPKYSNMDRATRKQYLEDAAKLIGTAMSSEVADRTARVTPSGRLVTVMKFDEKTNRFTISLRERFKASDGQGEVHRDINKSDSDAMVSEASRNVQTKRRIGKTVGGVLLGAPAFSVGSGLGGLGVQKVMGEDWYYDAVLGHADTDEYEFPISEVVVEFDADLYPIDILDSSELKHYGVRGMKWGVRRELQKAAPKDRPGIVQRRETSDELKHFGIKGMKWGVRKKDKTSGKSSSGEASKPASPNTSGEAETAGDRYNRLKARAASNGPNSLSESDLSFLNSRTSAMAQAAKLNEETEGFVKKALKKAVKKTSERAIQAAVDKAADKFIINPALSKIGVKDKDTQDKVKKVVTETVDKVKALPATATTVDGLKPYIPKNTTLPPDAHEAEAANRKAREDSFRERVYEYDREAAERSAKRP